jgi:thioredoxin 1
MMIRLATKRGVTSFLSATILTVGLSAFAAIPILPEAYRAKAPNVKFTMVEFSAPWCISCQLLKPSVKKLIEEAGPSLHFTELNIDEAKNQKMVKRYGVIATPTILLFDTNGKSIQRFESDVHPTELRKGVLTHLGKK